MNNERVNRALKNRALMWHRATSTKARDENKAVSETNTVKLRRSYWNLAIEAGRILLRVLIEETIDQRPRPIPEIEYNGILYRLQSVDGINYHYVKEELFNEDCIKLNPITHETRIHNELISMREMAAIKIMALTPTEK